MVLLVGGWVVGRRDADCRDPSEGPILRSGEKFCQLVRQVVAKLVGATHGEGPPLLYRLDSSQ